MMGGGAGYAKLIGVERRGISLLEEREKEKKNWCFRAC